MLLTPDELAELTGYHQPAQQGESEMHARLLITRSAVRARPGEPSDQAVRPARLSPSEYFRTAIRIYSVALALLPALALAAGEQWDERPVSAVGRAPTPRAIDVFYSWSKEPKKNDYPQCPPDGRTCLLALTAVGIPADAHTVTLISEVNITQPSSVSSVPGTTRTCWVEAQFGIVDTPDKRWTVRVRSSAYGTRTMQSAPVAVHNGMVALSYRFRGTNGAADRPHPKGCSFMLRISAASYMR